MTTYVDDGIVLRRVDYSETDRVLTVLTREHGKVGVLARGVRKHGSKLAPHTDMFARSRMQLASGRRELAVLAQAQSTAPAPHLQEPRRAACAALVAELADRVLEADHPLEDGIFDLVASALVDCGEASRDPRAGVAWFARRMIDRLGYAPELRVCANCGSPLDEQPHPFSAAGGGLLCPRCAPSDPGAVMCSVTTIKVLRVIASGDAELYSRLRLDADVLATLENVVERELAMHLDRRLRSLDVLRSL